MTDDDTQATVSPFNAPWSLRFEHDGIEDIAVIYEADGEELLRSRPFWLPMVGEPEPPTLTAMRLIQAAPALLEALRLVQRALNTAPRFPVGDTDGYQIASRVDGAIALATNPLRLARLPIAISEDEFGKRFPLLTNHLNPDAGWDSDNEGGCLFGGRSPVWFHSGRGCMIDRHECHGPDSLHKLSSASGASRCLGGGTRRPQGGRRPVGPATRCGTQGLLHLLQAHAEMLFGDAPETDESAEA